MKNNVNTAKLAESLGLSQEGLAEFLRRQKGALAKRKVLSTHNLLYTYTFLIEIKEREDKEKSVSLMKTTKNIKVAKYAQEIEDLFQAGYGATRIMKYLYENHRHKVSKSSIERYIKDTGLRRE